MTRSPRWTYRRGVSERLLPGGLRTFYVRFVDVDGKRKHRAVPAASSAAQARELLEEARARVRRGLAAFDDPAVPARLKEEAMTVREVIDLFCKEYQSPQLKDPKLYRREAKSVFKCHVTDRIGDRPARELERKEVVAMRDKMIAEGVSTRQVARAITQLARLFSWALDERELWRGENPCRRVRKPRIEGATSHYSHDEIARLLRWAAQNDRRLYPMIAFAFYTGCRKGEIAALRWSDLNLEAGSAIVARSWKSNARKSGKPVAIALHPQLWQLLRELEAVKKTELVFPGRGGRMRGKGSARALWGLDKAIVGAKVRRFKSPWHAFRHTHATTLAVNGAGLTAIRDALGQTTLYMAANYTHLAAEHLRALVEKLPSFDIGEQPKHDEVKPDEGKIVQLNNAVSGR